MRGESLEQMIRQKFSYVVSCQAYGQHKKARDPKAADTEYLVQRFRNLRVAYVDKAVTFAQGRNADGSPGAMRESVRFYSVLAKGVREGAEEVMQEVFRVQLPGDIMLGEGMHIRVSDNEQVVHVYHQPTWVRLDTRDAVRHHLHDGKEALKARLSRYSQCFCCMACFSTYWFALQDGVALYAYECVPVGE